MCRAGKGTKARIKPRFFVQPALVHDVTAQPGYYVVLKRVEIQHSKTGEMLVVQLRDNVLQMLLVQSTSRGL